MRRAGGAGWTRHAFRAALIFAAAGAVSRFTFRTFETRWQIAIFWTMVVGYQLVLRTMFAKRISLASTALDLGCVAAAIIAVKVAIEGQL